MRFLSLSIFSLLVALSGVAQEPRGEVLAYSGAKGELIMSRDGIIYWLESGSELQFGDILRSRRGDSAIIKFDGCELTLPEGEDVRLDHEFCGEPIAAVPSAAENASNGLYDISVSDSVVRARAPLVVGGVVLSAGGLVAAIGGDGGGAGSATSAASGAASSNPNSS